MFDGVRFAPSQTGARGGALYRLPPNTGRFRRFGKAVRAIA